MVSVQKDGENIMKFDPKMPPRQVEAYLRAKVLEFWGNKIENAADITSGHGFYSISIPVTDTYTIKFENFRRKEVPRIAAALKYLSGGDEYFEEPKTSKK